MLRRAGDGPSSAQNDFEAEIRALGRRIPAIRSMSVTSRAFEKLAIRRPSLGVIVS